MKYLTKKLMLLALTAGSVLGTTVSHASGFAIIEQSVSGLGNAFAGGAASAEDATTVFFNPAGMTRVGNSSVVGALHYIQPSIKFKKTEALDAATGLATDISGGEGGDAGESAVVPNLYFTTALNDEVTFGVGMNAPYGLSTKYDEDWVGRYHGVESGVKTININPSLAFKVSDALSLGVGVSFQQLDAVLSRAINGTALCGYLESIGQLPALTCSFGSGAEAGDIYGEVTGTSTAFGANYGLLYSMSDRSRIGFHYRSVMRHRVKGDADFDSVAAPLAAGGFFADADATTDITLPASASLSIFHAYSKRFSVMADVTWTQWSVLDEVRIEYSTGTQGDTVEEFGWSNTMRYALGATFAPTEIMTLRAGLAYDESPVHNETKRGVRLPDNDRTWLSLGAAVQLAKGFTIEGGFAHLIIDDAEIRKEEAGLEGTLVGDYEMTTNIVSVQAAWSF